MMFKQTHLSKKRVISLSFDYYHDVFFLLFIYIIVY